MVFRTHREKFFLFLVCLIIGTMVSTQFRSAEHAKQSVNQQRAEDLAEKLKNAEKENKELAKQLEELELAYAVTIHKSQGSEYPAVVIPLLSGPRMLLNRNLLYTAVTRARRCVTIVGSEETFREMIKNEKQQRRYSSLDIRLKEEL